MANVSKYIAGTSTLASPASLLTTELNSLANNTASSASSAYDNQTNLDLLCDLILELASFSPSTGGRIDIYILPSYDGGTNYLNPSAADVRVQAHQLWVSIPLSATAATAQKHYVRGVALPPQRFKVVIDNQSGAALASSGNTLKISSYNFNLNG